MEAKKRNIIKIKLTDITEKVDLFVFDDQILDDELWTQPHVAIPAADVAPDLKNPQTGETISQAAERLLPGITITKHQPN